MPASIPPPRSPPVRRALAVLPCLLALAVTPASAQRVEGRVVDARDGTPLAGATVALVDAGFRTVTAETTGPGGRFVLVVPEGGPFALSVGAPGFVAVLAELPGTGDATTRTVRLDPLPAAASAEADAMVRACGGPPATRAAVLGGFVRAADAGLALDGVSVVAAWESGGRAETETRDGGAWILCALPSDREVRVHAAVGSHPGDEVRGRFDPGRMHRIDLEVPLGEVLETGGLLGRVVERDGGRPVAGAEVRIAGTTLSTLTDRVGQFTLPEVPGGVHDLVVDHLAYARRSAPIFVVPGRGQRVEVEMAAEAIELEGFEVTVRSRSWFRDLDGFQERRRIGFGHFFDATDIERRAPLEVVDMLRTVPGARVVCRGYGSQGCTVRMRGARCAPTYYVDGARMIGEDVLAWMRPEQLDGMEVYRGAAGMPARFAGMDSACGAVVLWTKRGR